MIFLRIRGGCLTLSRLVGMGRVLEEIRNGQSTISENHVFYCMGKKKHPKTHAIPSCIHVSPSLAFWKKNVKDETSRGFLREYACLNENEWMNESMIHQQNVLLFFQNVREGETWTHEGTACVFGCFSCPCNKRRDFQKWCFVQFEFLPKLFPFPPNGSRLNMPPPLILRKIMPSSL